MQGPRPCLVEAALQLLDRRADRRVAVGLGGAVGEDGFGDIGGQVGGGGLDVGRGLRFGLGDLAFGQLFAALDGFFQLDAGLGGDARRFFLGKLDQLTRLLFGRRRAGP